MTVHQSVASPDHAKHTELVQEMVSAFIVWSEREGFQSYDWLDLWATQFAQWAKSSFVRSKALGSAFVAPLLALDVMAPGIRKLFASPRSYPICHAHMGLGYLNLYAATGREEYKERAEGLVTPLLELASPQAKGLGWGMKHDWMTVKGLVPKDTPCHSQTGYPYEFFAALYSATSKEEYQEYLKLIAVHEANDFPEWQTNDTLVSSYSTIDARRVVNANSYRMVMLLDAGERFQREEFSRKGMATLRYILSMQQADGSWPYAEDELFVDTYHTCFVLRNLHRVRVHARSMGPALEAAIERGKEFYFQRLLDKRGYPIPFAVKPRLVLHQYDSYDLAESIGLLSELGIDDRRLARLVLFVRDQFQTHEGWFVFRRYPFLHLDGIPYMRYANSAMFLALTRVLRQESSGTVHDTAG